MNLLQQCLFANELYQSGYVIAALLAPSLLFVNSQNSQLVKFTCSKYFTKSIALLLVSDQIYEFQFFKRFNNLIV